MASLGLDFGTTNSVLAVWSGGSTDVVSIDEPPADWASLGFDRVLPSVIAIDPEGAHSFGWRAKQRTGDKLEAVKRLFATEEIVTIGQHQVVVEEAAAMLFGHIKAAAAASGLAMDRTVVTIPANSRGVARFRTKLCAGLAGIEVPALVNEPTAAAIAHSISGADDQTILVFDWGGGTLDVTVLETVSGVFIEKASSGIQRLGGIDIDEEFAKLVKASVAGSDSWNPEDEAGFRLDIERAKILLSEQDTTEIPLPGGGYHTATRADFERAVAPLIERAAGPVQRCLDDLRSLGLDQGAIDHVVMVGGTSKIPAVRSFMSDFLGKEPSAGADPMTAIAEGAAIASAILAGEVTENDFFVGTEHALGTIVHNDGRPPEFSVLIPRNQMLPAKATDGYFPAAAGQESVLIRVIEGDPDAPLESEENVILKVWDIDIPDPGSQADTAFDITYTYDVDGILHVKVVRQRDGLLMLEDSVSFGVTKDKGELVQIAQRVKVAMDTGVVSGTGAIPTAASTLDQKSKDLVARARSKVMPFVDDDEAGRIGDLVGALESADPSSIEEARDALDAALRPHAYLF